MADLATARASYALAEERFRFRCAVCGGFHRAGCEPWRQCAARLAEEWGLCAPGWPHDVRLNARVQLGFFPTLAEGIRLGASCPGGGWRRNGHEQLRPPAALKGRGAWPVMLALDRRDIERLVCAAWECWWERVVDFLRQVDAEVASRAGGTVEGIREPHVLRAAQNQSWWGQCFYTEPYGLSASPALVHVGRRAAAYSLTEYGVNEGVVVVHWHQLGARVAVYYGRGAKRRGVVPPAWWFLEAAGLA